MTRPSRHKTTSPSKPIEIPELGPIENIPIDLLKPYARNARTHDERQIALIAQSIETFGFINPIVAEQDGTIVAGHGRWQAAKQLGLAAVPVLRDRHMTPAKLKAYRLADNRLAELSGWDSDMLKIELGTLEALDLDFSIETIGWQHAEIDVILDPPAEASSDGPSDPLDDDIPLPPATPVSRLGDLWELDDHRLLVGSSTQAASFDLLMAGQKATMVFQDAPYNVPINGHVSGLGKVKHREFAMASGEMSPEQFQSFNSANLSAMVPHLVDGAILAMCMDWRGQLRLQLAMAATGIDLVNMAVWVKTNGGMGSLYRSAHELVLIGKHGKASHINNVQLGKFKRYRTNVWRYPGVNSFGAARMQQLEAHPTPKPIALVADAIRDVSHRGQIVLDSFIGSGTTLLAAERTGRVGYGIELDPGYVDVTIKRWQAMTGRSAKLHGSAQSFEALAAERGAGVDDESQP